MKYAIVRVLKNEINISDRNILSLKLGGLYEHIYKKDNLLDGQSIDTHCIVQSIFIELKNIDKIKTDFQNSKLRFFSINEIKNSKDIHKFVKSYFIGNSKNKLNFINAIKK